MGLCNSKLMVFSCKAQGSKVITELWAYSRPLPPWRAFHFPSSTYTSGSGFPIFFAKSMSTSRKCSCWTGIYTRDIKPDQALLLGQHQQPTRVYPRRYAVLKSIPVVKRYSQISKSSQSMIGDTVFWIAILGLSDSLSYLLREVDSLLRTPKNVRILFFPRNSEVIFLCIAPVLKIVQHQRITRLGGPSCSQSSSKFLSLFLEVKTGVFGWAFLKRAIYASVSGNSRVVSP